jgi:RHH-type transcriptional regulator, proline utilization regulon repressor / proline dehydrogenase / delta 1-pyrroline-5-carboxylate dehydrogenase
MIDQALESRIQFHGRQLFSRLEATTSLPLTQSWFDDQFLGLSMQFPTLKVQLFRFIDVLPTLRDPSSVVKHLKEYLLEAESIFPGPIRWLLKSYPESGFFANTLSSLADSNAKHMARKFIAGENVAEAVQAIRKLRRDHQAFTIDLLGEATITEEEAMHVQKQYLELLEGLTTALGTETDDQLIDHSPSGRVPRVNVSVKLSALFSQFDPIDPVGTSFKVRERLRPILRSAKAKGAFVNFDMEHFAFKGTTLQIFCDIMEEPEFHDWPDVGIAIQAYLPSTLGDLKELATWAKQRGTSVWIRLVKGAYWDYESVVAAQQDWPLPVFEEKWQSDASFEDCAAFLFESFPHLRPAFGSHNIRSIAAAIALAEKYQIRVGDYEFQALYGMADPIKQALTKLGHRVRIYTPYGQLLPGMAYLVRRLLENTSNESFLRASFTDHRPEEELLMNPRLKAKPKVENPEVHGHFRNEPLADFSQDGPKQAMVDAIAFVRKNWVGQAVKPFIDGKRMEGGKPIPSVNPSNTKEILGSFAPATVAQAKDALSAASLAFSTWAKTTAQTRAELLRKIAKQMREQRWHLSALITLETGKPWRESDGDVCEAIDFCEYYALEILRLDDPRMNNLPGEANQYRYYPRGVAVVIAPWNFPLAILCGMATAAVVTGNTVLLKPAEQSTLIAAKFFDLMLEAGLPTNVVQFLPGIGEEIGPVLVQDPRTAMIVFTGSQAVGLGINASAAIHQAGQTHIKRVVAELGGKNAIIVDDDADLDEAVRGVVDSTFGYAGQKCSACSRVIVLPAIYDAFITRLIEATKSLTISSAELPGCSMGPVIDEDSVKRIEGFVMRAKEKSNLAFVSEIGDLAKQGSYVPATIFTDVSETAEIAQEEIFGPVLAVIKAKDLEDAIRIANGTKYALTGGVFSRSPKTIERIREEFLVGNLYINRKITGALVDRHPFGGFKLSGVGSKAGGPDYLLQFLVPRAITENTMRRGFAPETGG